MSEKRTTCIFDLLNHLCHSNHAYTYNYLSVNIEKLQGVTLLLPVFWGPDLHLHFHLGHCEDAPWPFVEINSSPTSTSLPHKIRSCKTDFKQKHCDHFHLTLSSFCVILQLCVISLSAFLSQRIGSLTSTMNQTSIFFIEISRTSIPRNHNTRTSRSRGLHIERTKAPIIHSLFYACSAGM